MAVEHALAGPGKAEMDGHDQLLREVLPLLVAGSYILTDPRGAITSCGVQAEALFGLNADEARGRQLTAALTGSTEADEAPLVDAEAPASSTVELKARDRNGKKCPCQLSVVPIDLRHGTAFSALIRGLESAGPVLDFDKIFERHGEAFGILGQALAGDMEAEEGVRLAGVMVIIRPLAEVSWLHEVRQAVVAARVEGAQPPSAAASAPPVTAAEAADRLARTGDLLERVERATRAAESSAQTAERAIELATGQSQWIEALESRLAAQESVVAESISSLNARVEAIDGLHGRMAALEEQLAANAEAQSAVRADDAESLSTRARAEMDEAHAQAEAARTQMEQARTEVERARGETSQARDEAQRARAETEDAKAEAQQARAETEQARAQATAAREAAEEALAAAKQAAARADEAGAQVLDARRELSEAGDRLVGRTAAAAEEAVPAQAASGRAPIAGLDDVDVPVARLDLDGRFRHLNDAFAALVGYVESEFRSASWPSLIDRDNRDAHRELFEGLREGRVEEGRVETFYTGGAGLLVPVAGRISLARDDQGEPDHLLFEVDAPEGV